VVYPLRLCGVEDGRHKSLRRLSRSEQAHLAQPNGRAKTGGYGTVGLKGPRIGKYSRVTYRKHRSRAVLCIPAFPHLCHFVRESRVVERRPYVARQGGLDDAATEFVKHVAGVERIDA
jgi:hypothetical protein